MNRTYLHKVALRAEKAWLLARKGGLVPGYPGWKSDLRKLLDRAGNLKPDVSAVDVFKGLPDDVVKRLNSDSVAWRRSSEPFSAENIVVESKESFIPLGDKSVVAKTSTGDYYSWLFKNKNNIIAENKALKENAASGIKSFKKQLEEIPKEHGLHPLFGRGIIGMLQNSIETANKNIAKANAADRLKSWSDSSLSFSNLYPSGYNPLYNPKSKKPYEKLLTYGGDAENIVKKNKVMSIFDSEKKREGIARHRPNFPGGIRLTVLQR
jgi:hypothetical protein